MSNKPETANVYRINSVEIISHDDEVAFVMTEAGGYVVETIPQVGDDAREAGILFVAVSLAEAIDKYDNIYG